ncbi:hypothetical protein SteCoe_2912 [Stentor coeruleus]|uniref:Uncharacterized protein n=1 Tax=Stentor coeruleus TaxID=5963 RepID=A0A1R2CYB4_9CILI|nr:hypothetical protein SteCoe_2912 [Stentor coeruleus]
MSQIKPFHEVPNATEELHRQLTRDRVRQQTILPCEKVQFYTSICTLPLMCVLIYIVTIGGSCSAPMNSWLEYLTYTFVSINMIFLFNMLSDSPASFRHASQYILVVLCFAQLGMHLTGVIIFVFEDNDCSSAWYSGYFISLVAIFTSFVQAIVLIGFCYNVFGRSGYVKLR